MSKRRIVDGAMTVLLLCLMAYQVTGETLHEWLGVGMTALVIVHQVLNRRWYGALRRGKYPAYRVAATTVNLLLLAVFFLTALCGMSMSGHAVPFLYGLLRACYSKYGQKYPYSRKIPASSCVLLRWQANRYSQVLAQSTGVSSRLAIGT